MTGALSRAMWLLLLLGGGCDRGDWVPLERTARELFNGWDMWDTPAVSPHQQPMPQVPAGTVAISAGPSFEEALAQVGQLDEPTRRRRAAVTYRRYCHHCHGPAGDGRIIVGESFGSPLPDLRGESVQTMAARDLYDIVMQGGGNMLPLGTTLTPREALLSLAHLQQLPPSRPFFPRRSSEPLE